MHLSDSSDAAQHCQLHRPGSILRVHQAGASDDAFSAPSRRRQRLLRMPLKALSFVRLADIRGDSPWQRYATPPTTPPHTHAREHIGKKFRQSADIVRLRTGTTTSFRRLDIERGSEWHSDSRMHCRSDNNTDARMHPHTHVALAHCCGVSTCQHAHRPLNQCAAAILVLNHHDSRRGVINSLVLNACIIGAALN